MAARIAAGKHYGGIGSAAVSTIHRKVRESRHDVQSRWQPSYKS